MNYAFCQYNDGKVYTSIPPQYRCTIDNEFHFGDYECDKEFAPVKHGHWEDSSNGWMCSECFKETYRDYQYCPHCGAKMDGE